MLNAAFGIMETRFKHPCIYCTAPAQKLSPGTSRTIQSLDNDHNDCIINSGEKKTCKNYNNIISTAVFECLPGETPILKITHSPTLHVFLGIFNQICKAIEQIFEEIKYQLNLFAKKHDCLRESYFEKTFEGSECSKHTD